MSRSDAAPAPQENGTAGAGDPGGVSWPAAVIAIPVTAFAWVLLTTVLTLLLADLAIGGGIAVGIIALVGLGLLAVRGRSARGAGIGTLGTLLPCAVGLLLSLW